METAVPGGLQSYVTLRILGRCIPKARQISGPFRTITLTFTFIASSNAMRPVSTSARSWPVIGNVRGALPEYLRHRRCGLGRRLVHRLQRRRQRLALLPRRLHQRMRIRSTMRHPDGSPRLARNVTQAALAEDAGIGLRTLRRLEAGEPADQQGATLRPSSRRCGCVRSTRSCSLTTSEPVLPTSRLECVSPAFEQLLHDVPHAGLVDRPNVFWRNPGTSLSRFPHCG